MLLLFYNFNFIWTYRLYKHATFINFNFIWTYCLYKHTTFINFNFIWTYSLYEHATSRLKDRNKMLIVFNFVANQFKTHSPCGRKHRRHGKSILHLLLSLSTTKDYYYEVWTNNKISLLLQTTAVAAAPDATFPFVVWCVNYLDRWSHSIFSSNEDDLSHSAQTFPGQFKVGERAPIYLFLSNLWAEQMSFCLLPSIAAVSLHYE